MGDIRPGIVLWSYLGLLLGTGACYYVYKRLSRKTKCKKAGFVEIPSDGSDNLEPHHIQKLIKLLENTKYCSVREQVLITLANSAAFSENQDLIRELNGITVIGQTLSDTSEEVKVKALNALNNLSMNTKNQEHIQVYIPGICSEVALSQLNSDLQLAGLRLLTNMSFVNDYHHTIAPIIPSLLYMLCTGNKKTQIQVLKVLVNLSANPSMTRDLLGVQVPSSLTSLFDSCMNVDVLLRALTFVANLNDSLKSQACLANIDLYSAESLFFLFFGDPEFSQRLATLMHHPDVEVKGQVARIMMCKDEAVRRRACSKGDQWVAPV
uniref:Armadillo repeat-containing protein 10 isoform X2 n=1 Tax=Geotrypetes seraphini TaxID=260995 RepID=A0A6P8SAF4_GEOSA|nr:armadillo repeat-containing protein 10 isoform X2 [Geotrypetes seraphini]